MKYSQKTLHSSPERARYGVSFVSSKGNILCRLVKIELYKIFAIINRAIKGLYYSYHAPSWKQLVLESQWWGPLTFPFVNFYVNDISGFFANFFFEPLSHAHIYHTPQCQTVWRYNEKITEKERLAECPPTWGVPWQTHMPLPGRRTQFAATWWVHQQCAGTRVVDDRPVSRRTTLKTRWEIFINTSSNKRQALKMHFYDP